MAVPHEGALLHGTVGKVRPALSESEPPGSAQKIQPVNVVSLKNGAGDGDGAREQSTKEFRLRGSDGKTVQFF